ncbi:MAG: AAA family ATPase [Tistlia sp.]|uniref:AAA family ATPase n=1 Tax=Tistlia sp. TaxID=3057121 RepID=UPI0034A5AD83
MTEQLDLNTTYKAILEAARTRQFISYGDLAKVNGAAWRKVRRAMNHHLGDLVEIAAKRDWPMPSAIVVNKSNVGSGLLEGEARDGFINAAKSFGFDVIDPAAFVREQQDALFAWAPTAPNELELTSEELAKFQKSNGSGSTGRKDGPHFVRLFGPLLDAMRGLGDAAEPKQIFAALVKNPLVTEEDLKAKNKNGLSKYENQVGWAKFYLAKAGLIESKRRGTWHLTSEGRETHLDYDAALALFRDIRARYRIVNDDGIGNVAAPSDQGTGDIFDDPNRRFWFVGAVWGGTDDQMERFLREGIWQNGYQDKYIEHVGRMRPGDRIAIKAALVKKYGLPFENQDKPVSCMRIKAIGTITENLNDGRTVKVDWKPLDEPRDWYFYTYRVTLVEADASDELARRLIQFTFNDHKQDYEFWLRQSYWAKRYRNRAPTFTDIEFENEEADADIERAEITPYAIGDILNDGCFLSKEALASALSHLSVKKNLILQGPPGTGKTWLAKRLGYALIGTKDRAITRKRMRSIQFHPSLSYEDFVRGWRPDGNGDLSLIDGVFLESVETARAEPDGPFVVIVEEINRGNPAQIFGEMLTLLEKDKRSEADAIELAYRREPGERVFIPSNLYVIGTMNIADRSLALVDLALRRRFAFVTLETALNESWRLWCKNKSGIDGQTLDRIQQLVAELNDEIAADRSLGAQFRIGHSYVTPAPGEVIGDARTWFRGIVETEIAPLLEEYWFDNLDQAAKSKARLLKGL